MGGKLGKSLSFLGFSLLCFKMIASAATAPEIPTIDRAYSKLSNSITVEWAAVPGAANYLLTAQDGESFIEALVTHSPGTVTGLKAATVYKITVRSISAGGRSQASPSKKAKTVLAAPAVAAHSTNSDSLLVQWEAVNMAVGFSLSVVRSDGLGKMLKRNTTDTSLLFTGLDAGTLYTITAYAWDADGVPGDDATYNQRTSPHAPADIQVDFDGGELTACVSWTPTEGTARYTVMASGGAVMLNCSTSSTSCSISSLQCGAEYLISALASNDAGSSTPAKAVALKTVACAPRNVVIREDSPGRLSVSWSNVDFGDYFVAFVKSDDGLEAHCNTSHTHCDFPAECGFTYFISVFAYNEAGQSPLGHVFNYTTAPCCPSDFNPVFVSSDTAEIVWSPVRGAEMYETKAVDGSSVVQCKDTAAACTLSTLQCDTKYTITVYSFSEIRGSNTSCASKSITTAPCRPEIKNVSKDTSKVNVHWLSTNKEATYTAMASGPVGLYNCTGMGKSCTITDLPCGSVFSVSVVAKTGAGQSLPSYSVPLETAPCCPVDLTVTQVTQSVANISWTVGIGAQTYMTILESLRGQSRCHTLQHHCQLGGISCGTNYTVALKAISATGMTSNCTYQSYSSSACCPSGMKLHRLNNNGIRLYWRASEGLGNFSTHLYGSKGIFPCAPNSSFSYCDVVEIPCGDVYTVVISPVADSNLQFTFCPKRIYSVTCSGSSVGMVIYRGKRNAE
ncbi:fibronectin type III domain-containing protein 7 [Tachyglossus aculeatus]|uniref:fibronectin type III domain-containing protein 7 n=1 Tax=Tachyglossus aculeatus TaxID=9261 RepID=UPI0018F2F52D|nr:fibronectin type III domain-containing protein 7 [Tachyglossus aculeatus]